MCEVHKFHMWRFNWNSLVANSNFKSTIIFYIYQTDKRNFIHFIHHNIIWRPLIFFLIISEIRIFEDFFYSAISNLKSLHFWTNLVRNYTYIIYKQGLLTVFERISSYVKRYFTRWTVGWKNLSSTYQWDNSKELTNKNNFKRITRFFNPSYKFFASRENHLR